MKKKFRILEKNMPYFCNVLLSQNFPGRGKLCNRNKGDWYHSILLISDKSIRTLDQGEKIRCAIIHFLKGPLLVFQKIDLSCLKKDVFILMSSNGSEGYTEFSALQIYMMAQEKWGCQKIPYTHNYSQGYNCIGFTDDIIHKLKYGVWNPRIEQVHNKYNLVS
jgi:hypothetical protein